MIIDGAALVLSLESRHAYGKMETFQYYTDNLCQPYFLKQLRDTKRLDIVWDIYKNSSLESQARRNRGSEDTIKVKSFTNLPLETWKTFLRNDRNKSNFYQFLSQSSPTVIVEHGECTMSTLREHV